MRGSICQRLVHLKSIYIVVTCLGVIVLVHDGVEYPIDFHCIFTVHYFAGLALVYKLLRSPQMIQCLQVQPPAIFTLSVMGKGCLYSEEPFIA